VKYADSKERLEQARIDIDSAKTIFRFAPGIPTTISL